MKNSEIYRRTLKFSVMRLVLTIAGIVLVAALPLIAFLATSGMDETVCIIATGAGLIVGFIAFFLIARYGGYLFTAAQVAMITRGVASDELPADTYAAGKQAVKRRFATASVYFGL